MALGAVGTIVVVVVAGEGEGAAAVLVVITWVAMGGNGPVMMLMRAIVEVREKIGTVTGDRVEGREKEKKRAIEESW